MRLYKIGKDWSFDFKNLRSKVGPLKEDWTLSYNYENNKDLTIYYTDLDLNKIYSLHKPLKWEIYDGVDHIIEGYVLYREGNIVSFVEKLK